MKKYQTYQKFNKHLLQRKSILEQACLLLKKAEMPFIEFKKLIFLLNIDPKYANQQLRTSLVYLMEQERVW
jgi:hypothetical protein